MTRRLFISTMITAVFLALCAPLWAQDDVEAHRSCGYCGMDRKVYGYSRMLVVYEDGAEVGVCSLHCAAVEIEANPGRKIKALLVADRNTRQMVDVHKATWVLGGGKRGVMTMQGKWAFTSPAEAERFIAANGGKITSYDEALAATREEMNKNKMRRHKKEEKDGGKAGAPTQQPEAAPPAPMPEANVGATRWVARLSEKMP